MTTRSVVLFANSYVGRPSGVLFECPAGFHAILKSAYATNQGANMADVSVVVQRNSPYTSVYLGKTQLASLASWTWEGWIVLEPTDSLHLIFYTGPFHIWGSGALLPVPF